MKKTIKIFFVLLLCSFNSFAQNNYQTKRATSFSEHVTNQLKLTKEDQKFLYDTFINKFIKQQEKIKGKDLSDEEKKQVYKASRKELVKTLNGRFDSEKTKAIMSAIKELRNK